MKTVRLNNKDYAELIALVNDTTVKEEQDVMGITWYVVEIKEDN